MLSELLGQALLKAHPLSFSPHAKSEIVLQLPLSGPSKFNQLMHINWSGLECEIRADGPMTALFL